MNVDHISPTAAGGTSYLARPGGRIGYDVGGTGPLVVLVPGMGDLRAGYRFLAPALRAAGYRVACTDLRGHGDSDATFPSFGDQDTAGDVLALIAELGGPAVIVGNSMGAGSAVLAAAGQPDLVCGLVLAARSSVTRPFRPSSADAARSAAGGHGPAGVRAPVLVVMGEQDPDFPDPAGEADWIAQALGAQVVMVPETGHYPQSQRPDITTGVVLRFLATVPGR